MGRLCVGALRFLVGCTIHLMRESVVDQTLCHKPSLQGSSVDAHSGALLSADWRKTARHVRNLHNLRAQRYRALRLPRYVLFQNDRPLVRIIRKDPPVFNALKDMFKNQPRIPGLFGIAEIIMTRGHVVGRIDVIAIDLNYSLISILFHFE